jgi:hypothetical protein
MMSCLLGFFQNRLLPVLEDQTKPSAVSRAARRM